MRKWLPKGIQNDLQNLHRFAHFPILCQSRLLAALLAPFGSPLAPLGSLLAPLGSLFAPFGLSFAPFWCPLAHFCSPRDSIFGLSGYPGSIVGILLYFLDFCSPQGSILALSGYLGSIVGIFLSFLNRTSQKHLFRMGEIGHLKNTCS